MIKLTLLTTLIASINCAPINSPNFDVSTIASPSVNQMQSSQRSAGMFPFFNRRGLSLTDINSPKINQQQNIETDEYEWFGNGNEDDGFGGDNVFDFNSFNNVGGIDKTESGVPFSTNGFTLGNALNGLLFRRSLDLSYMASPTVYMIQDIESSPEYVGGVDEDGDPYWAGYGHLGAMGPSFIN